MTSWTEVSPLPRRIPALHLKEGLIERFTGTDGEYGFIGPQSVAISI